MYDLCQCWLAGDAMWWYTKHDMVEHEAVEAILDGISQPNNFKNPGYRHEGLLSIGESGGVCCTTY